ncbi:hypothetical protein FACS1894184_10120 [Clostridia bacterium]|nr:hypothetical protein FACS1894184_10120 [Clostridia bacterium]
MRKPIDMTGYKSGHLTVVELYGQNKHKECLWRCLCSCGNEVIVTGSNLRNGKKFACDNCFHYEQPSIQMIGKVFGRLNAV